MSEEILLLAGRKKAGIVNIRDFRTPDDVVFIRFTPSIHFSIQEKKEANLRLKWATHCRKLWELNAYQLKAFWG
jgi:hypothetical protein